MEKVPEEHSITPQDLITEEEVKKALLADKGKEAQIISWIVVNFTKQGDNYACVVTSVEVEYFIKGQTRDVTYVVKLNPCRHFMGFEELTHTVFLKESKFYLEIVPELNSALKDAGKYPLNLPRCFHANLESKNEQIYFEDLRARGFKMFDRRKGMDKEHTTFVLKEIARLHAASYLLQTNSPEEKLEVKYNFLLKDWFSFNANSPDVMGPMLEDFLANAVKMLKKVGGYDRAASWVESLKPKLKDLLTTGMKSERFDRICHGDCWNNNILFRYDDEGQPIEVMLLDLQMCRKASLATDLNHLLYTSLTGSVRSANLSNFISSYCSAYKDVIEAGGFDMHFSEDELLLEYREKNVHGAIFGMIILPAVLMAVDEVPDFSAKVTDFEKVMSQWKTKAMEMLDTNPMMKSRFLAIFDELTETGLIS